MSNPRHNFYLDDEPVRTYRIPAAMALGLHEAMLMQQLHYWLCNTYDRRTEDDIHFVEGRWWVWNSYDEWVEQFPFWSKRTIRRLFDSLREQGVVISRDDIGPDPRNRTLWYTIDYDRLREIMEAYFEAKYGPGVTKTADACGQSGHHIVDKVATCIDKNVATSTYTEPTSENTHTEGCVGDSVTLPEGDQGEEDEESVEDFIPSPLGPFEAMILHRPLPCMVSMPVC